MSWTPVFYSVNETLRPPLNRVHHYNSVCPPGRDMPLKNAVPAQVAIGCAMTATG
jgi:hypothetical protein